MVKKIPDLEEYITGLSSHLKLENALKEDICAEIRQTLYDKYNDFLVKGYGIVPSITYTLNDMEDSRKLAKMFNKIHKEPVPYRTFRFFYDKRVLLAGILATLITANFI